MSMTPDSAHSNLIVITLDTILTIQLTGDNSN